MYDFLKFEYGKISKTFKEIKELSYPELEEFLNTLVEEVTKDKNLEIDMSRDLGYSEGYRDGLYAAHENN